MLRCLHVDFMLIVASIIDIAMMKNEAGGQFFDVLQRFLLFLGHAVASAVHANVRPHC
jgi:hypothetical protein